MSLSLDNIVSKIVLGYLNPIDWSPLILELNDNKFVTLNTGMKAILFVNENHVILQDCQRGWNQTRFCVHKIMYEDWGNVFRRWSVYSDIWELEDCYEEDMWQYEVMSK